MTEIVLHDMSEYPVVLRHILNQGERRSPRGMGTFDLGFTTVTILNSASGGMPLGVGRNLNPAIGAVEAVQLVAGVSAPKLVLKVAPQFERYAEVTPREDGEQRPYFWGAYGERIKLQALNAIIKLTSDPDTRQAVITLWDPWLDNVSNKKDYPCTIALQFFMRGELLEMNTIMRSNDAWLGFPYDVFQFTQLMHSMANTLGVETGIYRHTALSMHIYERDEVAACELVETFSPQRNRETFTKVWQPSGFGRAGDNFNEIMSRATSVIYNKPIDDPTESEKWYVRQFHGEHSAA